MSKGIPSDIITDIFRQLPPKSLIRFRSLSKPLCSLIDDPDFVNLHLDHSLATASNLSVLLKDWNLYIADLDPPASPASDVPHPLRVGGGGGTEAVGSCRGLLALRSSERRVALYNAATRHCRPLPVAEIEPPNKSLKTGYVFYGFGFDRVTEDYKLLRMAHFVNEDEPEESFEYDYDVRVYSLRSDSWRRITDLPLYLRFLNKPFYHILHRRGYGISAGGALHWMLPCRPKYGVPAGIVAFDLYEEVFREVPQPDFDTRELSYQVDVGALDGHLCAMCNYDHASIDVWMMKEYGVKESWTKLFSVGKMKSVGPLMFIRPLVYSKDRDKVLLEANDGKLFWFDWKKRIAKFLRIPGAPESFGSEIYVGSLVSVKNPGEEEEEDDEDDAHKDEEEDDKGKGKSKRDDFLSVGFKLKL